MYMYFLRYRFHVHIHSLSSAQKIKQLTFNGIGSCAQAGTGPNETIITLRTVSGTG
jgi:hypothetical protein